MEKEGSCQSEDCLIFSFSNYQVFNCSPTATAASVQYYDSPRPDCPNYQSDSNIAGRWKKCRNEEAGSGTI